MEITSQCNGSCIYCPSQAYQASWVNRSLPIHHFRRLAGVFERVPYIHLQGWGEPFIHPDFVSMLKMAKAAGCRAGTTTNGLLLNRDCLKTLVEEGLDVIAFSLVGTDEKNDAIRKDTSIKKVIRNIEEIQNLKAQQGRETPKIHIAYMLLKSGLKDVHALPGFISSLGVDQAIVSTLSLVTTPGLKAESFTGCTKQEFLDLKRQLREVKQAGDDKGVDIRFHIAGGAVANKSCSENVERALVIGSDGAVSPCVMGNIPVRGTEYHYFGDKKLMLQRSHFGNALKEHLYDIWDKKEYRKFRKHYAKSNCRDCLKLYNDDLEEATDGLRELFGAIGGK